MGCRDSGCKPKDTYALAVILAGHQDHTKKLLSSNPGISSRIAHHIDISDCADEKPLRISDLPLAEWNHHLDPGARQTLPEYLAIRRTRPHSANALGA